LVATARPPTSPGDGSDTVDGMPVSMFSPHVTTAVSPAIETRTSVSTNWM
jgi:hypothetical protein